MNLARLVRQYFPESSDEFIDHLIWEETGYPGFWNIPRDGATPQDCFTIQIARAACRENFGEYGYFDSDKAMRLAMEEIPTSDQEC